MDLNAMAETAWQIAEDKGHHDSLATMQMREATLIRLALIHTEVSEAAQIAKRRGIFRIDHATNRIDATAQSIMDDFAEELADIVIRVGDLGVEVGVDLGDAVAKKFAKNRQRPKYFGTPKEDHAR